MEDASKIRKDLWNTINCKEKANINLLHDEDVQSICIDGKEILLRVEKYDNRFVLTNPRLLKLPIEQIYAGSESKAHNQRMQNMLRMIGYGENLGSGFPLILSAWNEKHWLKPELIEQPELMQVKLILRIENKKDVTKDKRDGTNH